MIGDMGLLPNKNGRAGAYQKTVALVQCFLIVFFYANHTQSGTPRRRNTQDDIRVTKLLKF
jgi:hypothetical protein